MYHPYTKCAPDLYGQYQMLGTRTCAGKANAAKFNCHVGRDYQRFRRTDRNTTGASGQPTYVGDELHPYHRFVEEFSALSRRSCLGQMGLVPLCNDDFQVLSCGQLLLNHPRFVNKAAYVVFFYLDCPECQDTKQSFRAYAIEAHKLIGTQSVRQCQAAVMYKQRDGRLTKCVRPLNVSLLNQLISRI